MQRQYGQSMAEIADGSDDGDKVSPLIVLPGCVERCQSQSLNDDGYIPVDDFKPSWWSRRH